MKGAGLLLIIPFSLGLVPDFQHIHSKQSLFRSRRDVRDCNGSEAVNTSHRLEWLRSQMRKIDVDAYYIPIDSEKRLEWVSGFSGSNGEAVVLVDKVYFGQLFHM